MEIAELLRLFVTDRVSKEALTTHTAGAPREEQMAQSSKRGREEDSVAYPYEEYVAESVPTPHQTQAPPLTPPSEGPLPFIVTQPTEGTSPLPESATIQEEILSQSEVSTTELDTPMPTEPPLRTSAWEAFRA